MRIHGWIALCLGALSTGAFAQPAPVTVVVGPPPFAYNSSALGAPTALAPITISENSPAALQDGYITLYGISNVEQELRFVEGTNASGSIADFRMATSPVSGHFLLVIEVDANDTAIDSITINPVANINFHVDGHLNDRFSDLRLELGDGHPILNGPNGESLAPGTPAGLGEAAASYTVGIFAGNGGIEIGPSRSLALTVGQTVTLPLNEGVPSHPAFVLVESLDPAIVSVDSNTVTEAVLTARAPGETRVQAWDPIGNSGYAMVTVSAAAAGPEPGTRPDTAPDSALPVLGEVMGEGGTAAVAVVAAAALDPGNGQPRDTLRGQEPVRVAAEIHPVASEVQRVADIFVAVRVTTPGGYQAWFQKNADGRFIRWDGHLENLLPMRERERLDAVERLDIYEGGLPPGGYELYFGYLAEGDGLVYGQTPLTLRVD